MLQGRGEAFVSQLREWESECFASTLPLHLTRPVVHPESKVLWENDVTVYVRAEDGIWQGTLGEPFLVSWCRLLEAEDTNLVEVSPTATHLLYTCASDPSWKRDVWVLPLNTLQPVELGVGIRPRFMSDGKHVLFSWVGLWMVSVDGTTKQRLTRQVSMP